MPYYRIDDKDSIVWFKNLIDNSLANPNTPILQAAYNFMLTWQTTLNNPVKAKEIADNVDQTDLGLILNEKDHVKYKAKPPRRGRPPTKAAPKKRKQEKEIPDPYACGVHKNRHGGQAPRDGCVCCWEIYKTLHPREYPNKRLIFERKQKGEI